MVWQRLEEGVSGLNDEMASEVSAARSLEQRVTITENILQDSDRLRYPAAEPPATPRHALGPAQWPSELVH